MGASGCVRLGIRFKRWVHLGLEPAEPLFLLGDRRLQALALLDQGRPFLGIALLARGLSDLVLAAANFLDGLKQAPALAFERDNAIDVIDDVGRDIAIAAVLFDRLGVGDDKFQIKHENTLRRKAIEPNSNQSPQFGHTSRDGLMRSVAVSVDSVQWPLTTRFLGKFIEQVGAGLDAAMKVGEGEFLVGPVQVIVILAPAQKQRIDAQVLFDQPHDRDRASLANEDGLGAKASLDRTHGGLDARGIDIDQNGRRAMMADDLIGHTRRADRGDVFLELPSTVWGPGREPGGN